MKVFRGARPTPRHRLAAATPHVAAGVAPAQVLWLPAKLSMWGNDVDGDCVTAEEAFAKACHTPELFISDDAVTGWAKANGFMNGAALIDVLDKMQAAGFEQGGAQYDDGPANSVDWTNAPILESAIALGPVKIGIAADQLEAVYQDYCPDAPRNGWLARGFAADAEEDHCVALCGYGPMAWLLGQLGGKLPANVDGTQAAYALFTWSSVGVIDAASMLAITAEAWVRNPTTVVKAGAKESFGEKVKHAAEEVVAGVIEILVCDTGAQQE